jgi:glycosyltransferase involved in cell wall biosynthesis
MASFVSKIDQSAPVRPVPRLAIVVPCYNEEDALPISASVLLKKLACLEKENFISSGSKLVLVDDGSKDKTWQIISALYTKEEPVVGLKLAHNKGHQNALLCGLMWSYRSGYGATISIDADLQDDVSVIDEMLNQYRNGSEIVYGVRTDRQSDTQFKRNSAQAYYKFMKKLGVEIVYNSADFRLLSHTALEALSCYPEVNLFLRGMCPSLGFASSEVYYQRSKRVAGVSKYPLKKMISLAVDGITSFSTKPLHIITLIGMLSVLIALVMLIYTVISVIMGHAVAGWGSLMVSIWLVGGFLISSVGITGEYVGKAYMESKHRPRYVIEKELK